MKFGGATILLFRHTCTTVRPMTSAAAYAEVSGGQSGVICPRPKVPTPLDKEEIYYERNTRLVLDHWPKFSTNHGTRLAVTSDHVV